MGRGGGVLRGTSIKKMTDNNDVIRYVEVERFIDGKMVSKYMFKLGSELVVKPLNKQKLKHRFRKVQVLSFIDDSDMYGLRVNVKFLDNGRRGKVEVADLDEI